MPKREPVYDGVFCSCNCHFRDIHWYVCTLYVTDEGNDCELKIYDEEDTWKYFRCKECIDEYGDGSEENQDA